MNIIEIDKRRSELSNNVKSMKATSFHERTYVACCELVTSQIYSILKESKTEDDISKRFRELLESHWERIKRTPLCYTALPESELTALLVSVAQYLATPEEAAIKLLMPGISTESFMDGYPDLDNSVDVLEILKTHVLGEGNYFIPVGVLNSLEPGGKLEFSNPYYDYQTHAPCNAYLNENEILRLMSHSPESRAIHESFKAYAESLKDASTLYDHLIVLCRHLSLNSSDGRGQEDNAGGGAYPAIIKFNEYFKSLVSTDTDQIPKEVRDEIERLLDLSSDPDKNSNATTNLATCIATRRDTLQMAIKKHEEALQKIAISNEKKQELTTGTLNQFKINQKSLGARLQEAQYTGNDSFDLNESLLKELKVTCSASSLADLNQFLTLSPETIKNLCNDAIQKQILSQIQSIEDWVVFATETRTGGLEALLALVGNSLVSKLCKVPEDVLALLIVLRPERIDMVLKNMQEGLKPIIHNRSSFFRLIKHLDPEQCTAVCNAMKDTLPGVIKTVTDFRSVLYCLNPGQCTAVCNAMKDTLPGVIKTVTDFRSVLYCLNPGQRTAVCNAMKDTLPGVIKTSTDFSSILGWLNPEQCTAVCNAMKDTLPGVIKTVTDFGSVLYCLNPGQCTAVCNAMKDTLPGVIKTVTDFRSVLYCLNPEQRTAVCSAMKDTLPGVIKTAADFRSVLNYLTPEQRTAVCSAMKDTLPGIIKTAADFSSVLNYLNPEQCTAVCNAMKDTLKSMFNKSADFQWTLKAISDKNRAGVLESEFIVELLPGIIRIEEDIPEIYGIFESDETKKAFNHSFFKGLLQELKSVAKKTANDDVAKEILETLHRDLTEESASYFAKDSSVSLEMFQKKCTTQVNAAKKKLYDNQGAAIILGKILLAIVTFGLVPLASAVKSKIETGTFNVRFFEAPGEREADDVSQFIRKAPVK